MVLADAVRREVESNILLRAERLGEKEADRLLDSYHHLIKLSDPETVPVPDEDRIRSHRHLIRHAADVPVLLSAMDSKPDWLLTNNIKHFTPEVGRRTGLRIATPAEFFRILSRSTRY